MISDAERGELQAVAESLMRDTVTITRPGVGEPTLNESTGLLEYPERAVLFQGPCRLRTAGNVSGGSTRLVGEDPVYISTPTLSIPVSAPRIPADSVAVISAVPQGEVDGHLRLGLRMTVTGPVPQTNGTAQRLQVQIDADHA